MGRVLLQLTKDDFALPSLAPKLINLAKEVTLGRGFQLLKYAPLRLDIPLACVQ